MAKNDISPLKSDISWLNNRAYRLMNELLMISRYLFTTLQAHIEIPTFQHRSYRSYYCALLLIRANRVACKVRIKCEWKE